MPKPSLPASNEYILGPCMRCKIVAKCTSCILQDLSLHSLLCKTQAQKLAPLVPQIVPVVIETVKHGRVPL